MSYRGRSSECPFNAAELRALSELMDALAEADYDQLRTALLGGDSDGVSAALGVERQELEAWLRDLPKSPACR